MTKVKKNPNSLCGRCGKTVSSAYNRPNSEHKTKRQVYPNLQVCGKEICCHKCLKTEYKNIIS